MRWDARKSNPGKGDFWACCPFHQEKSPSFHVDDRKGFYYCFGCQAKGDALSFLRDHDKLSFMEAVEELARIAGVSVPREARADPEAEARRRTQTRLVDWMEAAAQFYRNRLRVAAAQGARGYLERRGLSAAIIAQFGLGYAPPERTALRDHLLGEGAAVEALVEAGLLAMPDDGSAPYDRFRDRIMFPIRDGRGRCIAFGGRALSAQARAKYLNSPQTPLFDKSRTLYNLDRAREASGRSGALIVAEGYMDVIALSQAGFAQAVAPLGTAVTAEHLAAMWRIVDEPVMALDGDKAGLAAAQRLIDTALPLLSAGKSLRFALLPPGKDPDDVIREGGPAAMQAVLDAAEPMAVLLWRRETEGVVFDSPERRAALDRRLRAALSKIADEGLRAHYRADLAARRAALFAPASLGLGRAAPRGFNRFWRRDGGGARRAGSPSAGVHAGMRGFAALGPTSELRASALARSASQSWFALDRAELRAHEGALLAALSRHPSLIERWGDEVADLDFVHADLDALRGVILADALVGGEMAERPEPAAALAAAGDVARNGFARAEATLAEAEQGVAETLERLTVEAALRRELSEAEAALAQTPGAELDGRMRQASLAAQAGRHGRLEEVDDDDARLSQELRDAIASEIWIRKKRRP